MNMAKGAQARMESPGTDGEPMHGLFGSLTGEPELSDNGSSDEFDNEHYGRWPSMRTPD